MKIANGLTCTYCDRPFGQYNPIVNSALQYINQKFRTISLLNELADNLFVTQEYLSRRFSKGVGISLNRYLTMKRIDICSARETRSIPSAKSAGGTTIRTLSTPSGRRRE